MTFQHLLDGAEFLSQSGNPDVSSVEYDSRRVKPGSLFVAMRGESSDGNRFIDQAIQTGAVAIVTDSPTEKPREGVAWALVPHGRRALARISQNFYKRPAERMAVTGITGTNGKSTTAFLMEAIFSAAGRKSALIGTIEYHVAGSMVTSRRTQTGIWKPTKPCMIICPAMVPTVELEMPEAMSESRKTPAAAAPSSGVNV